MVSQQLRVYAPHVVQRCLELGRHNPDYNIGIQHGLDILNKGMSGPCSLRVLSLSSDNLSPNDPISTERGHFTVFEVPVSRVYDALIPLRRLKTGDFRIFLDFLSRTA